MRHPPRRARPARRDEARAAGGLPRAGFTVDHDDVKEFSDKVFKWWQNHHSEFPTWSGADGLLVHAVVGGVRARLLALKQLFGKQLSSLMDYIQGSIMLNYNDRAL